MRLMKGRSNYIRIYGQVVINFCYNWSEFPILYNICTFFKRMSYYTLPHAYVRRMIKVPLGTLAKYRFANSALPTLRFSRECRASVD